MRIPALAAIEVASIVVGIATAIIMAWQGFGYWALVGMTAGSTLANCALVWAISKWRPGLPKRGTGVRPMLIFGSELTGANVLNFLTRNSDTILIGFFSGSAALGLYSKAYSLLLLPVRNILSPISAVAMPTLSRTANLASDFQFHVRRISFWLHLVVLPSAAFAFVFSEQLVVLFLGPQWYGASALFRALSIGIAVQPITTIVSWSSLACGHSRRSLHWNLFAAPLRVLTFAVAAPYGPLAVAYTYSIVSCVLRPFHLVYMLRDTPATSRDLIPPAAIGTLLGLLILVTGELLI